MRFERLCYFARLVCGTVCCALPVGVVGAQQESPPNSGEVIAVTAQAQDWLRGAKATNIATWSVAFEPEQVGTHWIGADVTPADPTLRSQLGLSDSQGLVVSWIHQGSPAAQAGLEPHDVLVQLADVSLGSPEDLTKQVDAVGDKPAGLVILRHGKRLTLQVTPTPARRVQAVAGDALARLAVVGAQQSRYWIGVELSAPEETLRSQLKLPQDQGVVVVNVIDDGPAAKAGMKKHDVLLMLTDKPIAQADDLRDKLQEIGDKPVPIKLVREGKPITIEVTPQKHEEPTVAEYAFALAAPQVSTPLTFEVVRPATVADSYRLFLGTKIEGNTAAPSVDPQARIQQLIAEMKELQKKLESLSEELKQQSATAQSEKK